MKKRAVLTTILSSLLLLTIATFRVESSRGNYTPAFICQSSAPASQPVTIPFDLVNRHMILKVSVNNSRPLSFVLDTGDQYAIIDLELAKKLGLKLGAGIRVGGAGSAMQSGAFVKDASFAISQLPGFSQAVSMALPIRVLAPRLGQDFDGIIGSDFIEQFVVEVDYLSDVVWSKTLHEVRRRNLQRRQVLLHARAGVEEERQGDRLLAAVEERDVLLDAILEDREFAWLEVGDVMVQAVGHRHTQRHDIDAGAKGGSLSRGLRSRG